MNRFTRGAAAVFVGACVAGCQTGFAIKVEKLAETSSRKDEGTDLALKTVHDILMDLDDLCIECSITGGEDGTDAAVDTVAAAQQPVRALLSLTEELAVRRARGELGGCRFTARVDALRRRALDILPRLPAKNAGEYEAATGEAPSSSDVVNMAQRLPSALAGCERRLASIPARPAGFGGFRQAGVYQINPGDPAYAAVLQAAALDNPLTCVTIRTTGDTGVMIVQESPGQMRLYQISNDPLSLMRNATLILDKVLQAAVKFGTTGGL